MYLLVAGRNEKKNIYTYVFGYFSNSMCERKKNVYMYFWVIFQQFKRKKKFILKKCKNGLGPLPKLYCDISWWVENCIAREGLLASVLQ